MSWETPGIDAIGWSSYVLNLHTFMRSVAWTGSEFVAVGEFGSIYSSADGVRGRAWRPIPWRGPSSAR